MSVNCKYTDKLIQNQLKLWPEHEGFLSKSFSKRSPEIMDCTEIIAQQIFQLIYPDIEEYCTGYRWMCEAVLQEELYFRRYGKYQATSFEDVCKAIYSNPKIMKLYMNGLLLSQVFWLNHVEIAYFYKKYLSGLRDDYTHLEIGPGHGLLLAHAALDSKCKSATAWDISNTSLHFTKQCLKKMNINRVVNIEKRSIYDAASSSKTYDSIVISEVLEHLEDPVTALYSIKGILAKEGKAFINIPCNSPAPDHIYHYKNPDAFFYQLEEAGFFIQERFITPSTGWSLEKALRDNLAISCAAVVVKNSVSSA